MKERSELNVVFLLDKPTPEKVILLKRASTKTYAPDFFTGIGGKIGDIPGLEDETPMESAYRELNEETDGTINSKNTTLTEFARCHIDAGVTIYYFWGIHSGKNLPHISPAEGQLVSATTDDLLDYQIIPTTLEVCRAWKARGFSTGKPFTVYLKHTGMEASIRLVKLIKVEEGLKD